MDNPKTIHLNNAGPIIGKSPEARCDWQCVLLSMLSETSKTEIEKSLRGFICEAAKNLRSSLVPIMDRLCGRVRPYIDEIYIRQALLPFLVRTIDLTFGFVSPITVLERPIISKESLFDSIKQNFKASEADLLARFEKELQNNEGRISLESFYANIVSDFMKLTYG